MLFFSHFTSLSNSRNSCLSCDIKFSISIFRILSPQRKLLAFVKFLSALHDSGCVEGKASDLDNAYPQVKGLQDSTDTRYKALEKRLAALEGQRSTGAAPDVDTPSD